MIKRYSVDPCTCKALMRPRWSRDGGPRVFICRKCGRPVPGYEELYVERLKWLEDMKKKHD
jgi:hypothetical protein